jgi:predicted nucleic acid-binding Zn ribbon protein
MPTYEWICRECKIYWDRECRLGKAPDRTRCPECKKLSSRYWQQQGVAISFKDDGCGNSGSNASDFHTVKRRYEKHAEDGYDQNSATKWIKRQIEASRNSQDDETYRYKSANINYEKFVEEGKARRLNDKEALEKKERAKKLTIEAYDRANKMGYKDINKTELDITKPQKQG